MTDEGYDPIYGARPLRRAIMKYLEDTLAEQCLSKTLYPNTKIYVRRKKVDGTLMTYTNELEVEIDFSDVDPTLLDELDAEKPIAVLSTSDNTSKEGMPNSSTEPVNISLGGDQLKPATAGRASKFFRKKE